MTKILAFAGSLRKDSLNKKLALIAVEGASSTGAVVTYIDLKDYPLPLYDGDVEAAGFPENALKLKALFMEHDALLIASPEYNSAFSAVLKNVIDWVSRKSEESEAPLACFTGKTALILSASPSALGGLRGLVALRLLLSNLKVLVLPEQKGIAKADITALEKEKESIKSLGKRLAMQTKKLS